MPEGTDGGRGAQSDPLTTAGHSLAPPPDPHDETLVPAATADELPGRSVQSGLAQLGSHSLQVVLLIGSGMAMARLLRPIDFGLLAMVSTLTSFVESFRHFGLPQAALHRDDLTQSQISAVFWHVARLTSLTVLAMLLAAPLLALFYGEARLIAITACLSLAVAVRGSTAVHETLLMRRLQFSGLVRVELAALAVSLTVGLSLAVAGAGYWALVAQASVLAAAHAGALWWSVPWRPARRQARPLQDPAVRELFGYGRNVTRFQMLTHIGRNTDRVVVGYFSGASSLGFYDAAYRWSLYPIQQVLAPLTNVAVASLSRVRGDAETYRIACRRALLPVFSVLIPVLAFLALEADGFIRILLGEQWLPAIPLFRILCIGAIGSSIIKITRWLFLAEGQTARQLRWGLVFTPVMVVVTLLGVPWGPVGVAVGYTAGTWLMVPSAVRTCLRESVLRPRDIYSVATRPAIAAVTAAALTWLAGEALPGGMEPLPAFLLDAFVFGAVYVVGWLAQPQGPERARELMAMLKHARTPRTRSASPTR
jgi:O-antigen/teichoic acid export membrane protein